MRIWIIVLLVPLLIACSSAKAVDHSPQLSIAPNFTTGNASVNTTYSAVPPAANAPIHHNDVVTGNATDNATPDAASPAADASTHIVAAGTTTEPIIEDNVLTIVALPDTQFYSQSYPNTYNAMTRWISDRWDIENFDFVVHLGDRVENNDQDMEWQRASYAMSLLGSHPYTVLPGNHDFKSSENGTHDYSLINKYFPASILAPYSNKGTFPSGTMINNYVEVKGYLILSIGSFYDRDLRPPLREWIVATIDMIRYLPL